MNIYFQDIMERIRMHYKKMTNTERIIADFFLSNTEKMEFSAKAVAARLHVSEPAMTRFSKKIGFSGYREFQYLYEINFQMVQCDDEELLHRIIDTYQKILLHFDGGFTSSANLYPRLPGFIFSPWAAPPVRRGSSSCVSCGWGFWWRLSTIRT